MPENYSVEAIKAVKDSLTGDINAIASAIGKISGVSQQAMGAVGQFTGSLEKALGISGPFSKGLDAVATALGAVQTGCDAFTELTTMISAAKQATDVLADSTRMSEAALKLQQIATGISTGTINFHTIAENAAAVAANVWAVAAGVLKVALAALSGPVGWVIAGVAALAVGIAALVIHLTSSSAAFEESKAEIEEFNAANERLSGSIRESADAFEDSVSAIMGNAEAARILLAGVLELANMEKRTAQETAVLKSRIETLNRFQQDLNLTLDETTGALSKTEKEINNYINLAAEAAKQNAVIDRMGELAGELGEVESQYQAAMAAQGGFVDMVNSSAIDQNEFNRLMEDSAASLENLSAIKSKVTTEMTALEGAYTTALQEKAAVQATLLEEEKAAILSFANEWGLSFREIKANMDENGQTFEEWKNVNLAGLEEEKAAIADYAAQWGVSSEEIKARCAQQGITFQELAETQQAAIDRIKELYGSLAESATDMFGRIETTSETTIDDMTANLLHNQEAVAQWSENIAMLAEMGIDDGLLQTLMEAGPEAAGYVQSIVNGSEEEIMKLSDAYAAGAGTANEALKTTLGSADISPEIMGLVTQTEESLYKQIGEADFPGIGRSVGEGYAKGISETEDLILEGSRQIASTTTDTVEEELQIQSPSKVFAGIGANVDQGMARGITEHLGVIKTAADGIVRTLDIAGTLYTSGQNAIQGFNSGMSNTAWKVYNTAAAIAAKVVQTINNALEVRSPSRLLRETGQYTMEGFDLGMRDRRKDIFATVRGIAGTVSAEMRAAAQSAGGIDAVYSYSANVHDSTTTGLLEKLLAAVQEGKVIRMDTGALVGATSGAYDVSLGKTKLYNERWRR